MLRSASVSSLRDKSGVVELVWSGLAWADALLLPVGK